MQLDDHVGMLAAQREPLESDLSIAWPVDIPEERRRQIAADTRFMSYLSGQPRHEQYRQIHLWRPPVDPAVQARREAELEAAREKREAELAALPTFEELCRQVRSLEAKVIEQGVRIAELESKKPKSRVIGRIARTNHSSPPDAA